MEGFNMEGMSAQAQQIWSMLDDMAQNDPSAYKKFIDKQMKDGKEQMAMPEPHMCVQVLLLTKPRNTLYINFCSWNQIPQPKSAQDAVPVSGTPITHEADDTGKYSLTSVAFNPKVLQEFGREAKNSVDADTLIQLALDYTEHEQKVKVSRSYTVLPKDVLHKGDLNLIRMSLTKLFNKNSAEADKDINLLEKKLGKATPSNEGSLLSQLSNISVDDSSDFHTKSNGDLPSVDIFSGQKSTKAKKGLIEEIDSSKLPVPKYSLDRAEINSCSALVLRVNLPEVKGVSECELDISEDDIELIVPGQYELKLKLPSCINDEDASAKFSRKLSTLTVTMPVKS